MTRPEFKAKQIEVLEAEKALYKQTMELLIAMLESMSGEELNKLRGHELDDCHEIERISAMDANIEYHDMNTNEYLIALFDELTQEQAKGIIDTIMFDIFGL
jgi:hypothetical protein